MTRQREHENLKAGANPAALSGSLATASVLKTVSATPLHPKLRAAKSSGKPGKQKSSEELQLDQAGEKTLRMLSGFSRVKPIVATQEVLDKLRQKD